MANEVTISVPIPVLDQYEVRLLLHAMQVILSPNVPVSMEFFEGAGTSIVVKLPAGVLLPRDVRQAVSAALRSIGRNDDPGEPQVHN